MSDNKKSENADGTDRKASDSCCDIVDPCGCYAVDPCGCHVDLCGCYVDPCCR